MSKEVFVFTSSTKKKLLILGLAGLILVVLGIVILSFGGHGHEADAGHEAAGHAFHWSQRLYADLMIIFNKHDIAWTHWNYKNDFPVVDSLTLEPIEEIVGIFMETE